MGDGAVQQGPGEPVLEERATSEGLLLAMLGQRAMRHLRAVHVDHGLSPRQFQVLGLLHDRGTIGQGDLGVAMDVDASVVVGLLNPLEAEGDVERVRDPRDRRRHHVRLTASGATRLLRAAAAQRAAEDELLAGLDTGQREQLRGLLLVLRDALEEPAAGACDGAAAD